MHPSRLKHALAHYLSLRFPVAWTQYNRTFRKHHFDAEYWLIPLFCRPDGIAVDVGANMGIYAFAMQRRARQVIAFEPNTDLWPFLRRFLSARVRLEDAALSDSAGQAEFRVVADNTGVATIETSNPLSMIHRRETIAVRPVATRTLDSFGLTDVSFIKIDVEGHEEAVLAGGRGTIAANRPVVLVEAEDRHNAGAPGRVADWFAALGYDGFFIKDRRLLPVAALSFEDTDPAGLDGGSYINNFLYLPRENAEMIERIRFAVER
ncbi:MAG TPA: FkbM family methyltransferase [Alphaproteobacteria bacterium]|jgi:FkbM family methyltransferase|nr:FkbM family methyltransferase [Alphaproteobacteria bacterium]